MKNKLKEAIQSYESMVDDFYDNGYPSVSEQHMIEDAKYDIIREAKIAVEEYEAILDQSNNFKVGQLLQFISNGQMIRIILLDEEFEESGSIEFENDLRTNKIDKNLLNKNVQFISSTEDDYIRIEVMK